MLLVERMNPVELEVMRRSEMVAVPDDRVTYPHTMTSDEVEGKMS